ncbi:MarR family winged helix-turn-helix transcriptional regulator [Actinoplanes sp. NBRC 103695]|uniref:MarR family winged helix-turn-helix transcriptional regulator n=1 Tax=Actinoplanes sp. NBRC 103695 TaxID=3032202 RepID=UPI002552384B|nr:MarR family winged helix-turn-helix transcriptional regulator [Actinoplanes sp. NBRC 103695]
MSDEGMGELFWAVARELRFRTRDALEPWAVTPAQSRALGVLLHDEPHRLGDLAERLRIAPRSATEVVDHLERRGLVERRPDLADRRATLIVLTDRGRAAADDIRAARIIEADRFFARLSPGDRADLARILGNLVAEGEREANKG